MERRFELGRRWSSPIENDIWNVVSDGTDTNLMIVAAKLLQASHGVEIVPLDPSYQTQDVKIQAPREIWPLLDELKGTSDFMALQEAVYAGSLRSILFTPTSWGADVKKQVTALYWERFAGKLNRQKDQYMSLAQCARTAKDHEDCLLQAEIFDSKALGAIGKSKSALGNNPPLATSDVTNLVRSMITSIETKFAPRT